MDPFNIMEACLFLLSMTVYIQEIQGGTYGINHKIQ